jgi:hypothetical protein
VRRAEAAALLVLQKSSLRLCGGERLNDYLRRAQASACFID